MFHLYERMHTVAAQARVMAPTPRTIVRLVDGVATRSEPIAMSSTDGAPRAEVELFDEDGVPAGFTTAAYFPYDHIDGGMLAFDEELPPSWTAEVVSLPDRL
jgi:hypothetical protein